MADLMKKAPIIRGDFWYQSQDVHKTDRDYRGTYYYSDSYFTNNSDEYHNNLATMSLCLAFSAFASTRTVGYANKSQNAHELILDIGFSDFKASPGYLKEPTEDSIGAVAAGKLITLKNGKKVPLIAIAIRGGGYQREWASNFTIGLNGDHEGFSQAKDEVIDFLDEYVNDHYKENERIKIWIAGYSRAAATSNLVAAEINKKGTLGKLSIDKNDLYAYTFATPAGALENNFVPYGNIFNVLNNNDPVPNVAPKTMHFVRYGQDHMLPKQGDKNYDDEKAKMKHILKDFESRNVYLIDRFQMQKIFWPTDSYKDAYVADDIGNKTTQGKFLETFVGNLVKSQIDSRKYYVDKLQDKLRTIFGRKQKEKKRKYPKLKEAAIEYAQERIFKKIQKNRTPNVFMEIETEAEALENFYKSLNKNSTEFRANDIAARAERDSYISAIIALIKVIVDYSEDYPEDAVTLLHNVESIRSGHFPEYYLAWLQSEDENYK